jgi:hypothetical protein
MSDSVRPEIAAVHELQLLVSHLADELAGFRRRALVAEGRLRELEEQGSEPSAQRQKQLLDRCSALEHENAALKGRLDSATNRTRQVLDRVRFIRQQTEASADR